MYRFQDKLQKKYGAGLTSFSRELLDRVRALDEVRSAQRDLAPYDVSRRLPVSGRAEAGRVYFSHDHGTMVVEYDGDEHYCNTLKIKADIEKDQKAAEMGYRVVRIPYWIQLTSLPSTTTSPRPARSAHRALPACAGPPIEGHLPARLLHRPRQRQSLRPPLRRLPHLPGLVEVLLGCACKPLWLSS